MHCRLRLHVALSQSAVAELTLPGPVAQLGCSRVAAGRPRCSCCPICAPAAARAPAAAPSCTLARPCYSVLGVGKLRQSENNTTHLFLKRSGVVVIECQSWQPPVLDPSTSKSWTTLAGIVHCALYTTRSSQRHSSRTLLFFTSSSERQQGETVAA